MKIPVSNKLNAYLNIAIFLTFMIGVIIYLYINFSSDKTNFIYLALILIIISLIFILKYLKTQNIKEVYYKEKTIYVQYKNKNIQIPISEISYIAEGMSSDLFPKSLAHKTIIYFKKHFYFGKKLIILDKFSVNKFSEKNQSNEVIMQIKNDLEKASS